MTQLLLNIAKVEVIKASKMTDVTQTADGVLLNYDRDWTALPTVGLSEYSVSSSVENKSRIYTHTITAFLSYSFVGENDAWAFLLTTVNGNKYVVGGCRHPFVLVNTEWIMPSNETGRSGLKLTATLKSAFGALRLLD